MSRIIARPVLGAVLLAGVLVAFAPSAATAHSELISADPTPNGSVVTAPDRLRLEFSQPIDPAHVSVELLDTRDQPIAGVGAPMVADDDLSLTVALPPLAPGVFTVSYQVVSLTDGHATAGIYAFLIDPTGAAPPPADSSSASSPSVDGYTILARWLALAALLAALGGLLLWRNAGRPTLAAATAGATVDCSPPWRLTAACALLGVAGIVAYLMLAARPITGPGTGIPLDVAGAFGWTSFAIAMRVAMLAAIAAGVLSILATRRPHDATGWWLTVAVLLATALAGMSLAGHAAEIGGLPFAALDWIHLLAVAAWLGALPAVAALAMRADHARASVAREILRRHGRVALLAAPVVALTGIANSPLVLGRARDLVASDYGDLLLAKAILLAVALGIGAVNHLSLRGRGRAATLALVAGELAVAALAVGVAATMVTIQPASARQPVVKPPPVMPAHFFTELGPSRVHLAVSLPAPGRQSYRVTVRDAASGAPRGDVQKVFVVFTPPESSGLSSQRVELEADALDVVWATAGAYTPIVGEWEVEVVVRRRGALDESSDFPLEVLSLGEAEVGPPPDTGLALPGPLAAARSLLPPGLLGWLPAAMALLGVALLGRLPQGRWRSVTRGTAAVAFVLAVAAAGSRTLVTIANAPTDTELGAEPTPAVPDVERGRLVYLANCAGCHGADLDGKGSITTQPPAGDLAAAVRDASDALLSYRIANGVAGTPMPAFAGVLSADERSDLIGYLRARGGSP